MVLPYLMVVPYNMVKPAYVLGFSVYRFSSNGLRLNRADSVVV